MVVKLNNGAVREIKKAEPIVEKRFTFNGDTLRMVAKANQGIAILSFIISAALCTSLISSSLRGTKSCI